MRRTLAELAARCGGSVVGNAGTAVTGVAIDSRAVRREHLFAALPGGRVDGHEFVPDAAGNGAAAALVSRAVDVAIAQLVVTDTLAALQAIAAAERAASAWRLAGVTGSVGKTTTKNFLAALLATTFTVGSTAGSRNSQAGFPAEVCNQPENLQWMVAELGMSHAGELDRLGAIARPDVLLYTAVAPVHLEFFADLDAIAAAKAELIRHLDPGGTLVLNAADPRVAAFAERFAGTVRRFGVAGSSDLWIEDYVASGLRGSAFTLRGAGGAHQVSWTLPGRHQADNLLAAACCALALGVPPGSVGAVAATLRPTSRRGEVHELPSGITVVDDSYNASPAATQRLLDLLRETSGRRVAVLGEMLELGETTTALHREAGAYAARCADVVVAVGAAPARELAAAAGRGARHVEAAAAALELLRKELRRGDVVLVKGSRGVGLDLVVDGLVEAC